MLSETTHAGAQHFERIYNELSGSEVCTGLVVGGGDGHEAKYLAEQMGTHIVSVDVRRPSMHHCRFDPVVGDALRLPFNRESFDFVFCYRVIEHVSSPDTSLAEIHRVLTIGGILYIGTPNRHRLLGYIGAYSASFREKVVWNCWDYLARLRGRFRNEYGAHAGFSQHELEKLLARRFNRIVPLTGDYLRFKYAAKMPKVVQAVLTRRAVIEFCAPAVYVLCVK